MEKVSNDKSNEAKVQKINDVPRVRNILLRAMCGVYLMAFVSFYSQAEGLYGDAGILPARRVLVNGTLKERLNLLQFAPFIGLDNGHEAIDLLCLAGATIAFVGLVSRAHCRLVSFIAMWTLYFSLVQVAQSFRQQADHLLLEAGFLCILLAPAQLSDGRNPMEEIALLLLKWLVFRFMFASGSVKLASGCPLWWSLDGLKRHYETMPLPTSYSWFTYQLPDAFHRLSTIYVYLSELVCPWLFFAPSKAVRRFALGWHVFLHLNIIGCGNYGFLSPLVLTLMLTLLDDNDKLIVWAQEYLGGERRQRSPRKSPGRTAPVANDPDRHGGRIVKVIGLLMAVGSWICFGIGFSNEDFLSFKPAFTKDQYLNVMYAMIWAAPLMVFGLMIRKFLKLLASQDSVGSLAEGMRLFSKNLGLLISTIVAFTVLLMSFVPHSRLLPSSAITSPVMTRAYGGLHSLYVVNQYGTHLTKMRPKRHEIVLEYTDDTNDTWHEFGFPYKPWTPERASSLSYGWFYFPRFDFKFYDAAGSKTDAQKWFYPMMQRLLQHQRPVLDLFDGKHVPTKPPKYIRASLYRYAYTSFAESDFWVRERLRDYFNVSSLDDARLQQKLKQMSFPLSVPLSEPSWNGPLRWLLATIRRFIGAIEGSYLVTGLLMAAGLLIYTQHQHQQQQGQQSGRP
ncbi:lipase maturation factor 2-like [Anopheles ziemanni]|uniref:lipase maturation factor 2-like n=1 Tax=Anopheles coustani TaxID=139045 RepID=UPI002657B3B0|nr:lipase maturation factor 2-like [Anopheles coustani]XP_058172044.1 lipase maturation factor 2-like [Anopheles ziemanni]